MYNFQFSVVCPDFVLPPSLLVPVLLVYFCSCLVFPSLWLSDYMHLCLIVSFLCLLFPIYSGCYVYFCRCSSTLSLIVASHCMSCPAIQVVWLQGLWSYAFSLYFPLSSWLLCRWFCLTAPSWVCVSDPLILPHGLPVTLPVTLKPPCAPESPPIRVPRSLGIPSTIVPVLRSGAVPPAQSPEGTHLCCRPPEALSLTCLPWFGDHPQHQSPDWTHPCCSSSATFLASSECSSSPPASCSSLLWDAGLLTPWRVLELSVSTQASTLD